ncbi:MAG: DinB family protein [Chloroflexota bacterium]
MSHTTNISALQNQLAESRANLMAALEGLNEADLIDKTAVGVWSVKDSIGHIIDWEKRMLDAVRHIQDPVAYPPVQPVSPDTDNEDEWNDKLVANRESQSWAETLQDLSETRKSVHQFMGQLSAADLAKTGACPWPDDTMTIAGLLGFMAEHDDDHIPVLEAWRAEKVG